MHFNFVFPVLAFTHVQFAFDFQPHPVLLQFRFLYFRRISARLTARDLQQLRRISVRARCRRPFLTGQAGSMLDEYHVGFLVARVKKVIMSAKLLISSLSIPARSC